MSTVDKSKIVDYLNKITGCDNANGNVDVYAELKEMSKELDNRVIKIKMYNGNDICYGKGD